MKRTYSIIFHPKAEKEFLESVNWYENALWGLGDNFITETTVILKHIQNNPVLFQKKKLQLREAPVKNFPFIIIYKINEKENIIMILSVFHTSRNPGKKPKP